MNPQLAKGHLLKLDNLVGALGFLLSVVDLLKLRSIVSESNISLWELLA